MMTTDELLDAALLTAAAGWPVFPCRVGAKEPATTHGVLDASTDPDQIRTWWSSTPFNIGMATGTRSVDVLDVDVKPSGNGFGALKHLQHNGVATGHRAAVATPSGGLHLYFAPSGNTNHTHRQHHLDVRGDGGYVIVPPSAVAGVGYRYISYIPAGAGVLDWAACLRLLTPPRPARTRTVHPRAGIDTLTAWLASQPATQGGRNSALFWACCRAIENGVTDLTSLIDAAIGLGLPTTEAQRTARSALQRLDAV